MTRMRAFPMLLVIGATNSLAASPANNVASTDPTTVVAGTYAVEPTHTRIQFSVMHFGFTNWNGDLTGANGSLKLVPKNVSESQLDISVPVASVSTTNAKLDGELKSSDWFDAGRFPTMRFVSTSIARTTSTKATISGNLTFHGVTKPVVFAATFNGAGINPMNKHYTVGFDATGSIRRSEFGVTKYIPAVGDETTLHISAAFEKVG
jgi:polyisoprenoid-binding protein YceI